MSSINQGAQVLLREWIASIHRASDKSSSRKPAAPGFTSSRKLKNSTRSADIDRWVCLCYPSVAATKGEAVKNAFDKTMADEWTSRALAHAIYGGADFGECSTTAERVAIGDADSWYRERSLKLTELTGFCNFHYRRIMRQLARRKTVS
jgi:hypothetical protein